MKRKSWSYSLFSHIVLDGGPGFVACIIWPHPTSINEHPETMVRERGFKVTNLSCALHMITFSRKGNQTIWYLLLIFSRVIFFPLWRLKIIFECNQRLMLDLNVIK